MPGPDPLLCLEGHGELSCQRLCELHARSLHPLYGHLQEASLQNAYLLQRRKQEQLAEQGADLTQLASAQLVHWQDDQQLLLCCYRGVSLG